MYAVSPLDRETLPSIQFMVKAYDLGEPSRLSIAMVTVQFEDINDNTPVFKELGPVNIVVPEGEMAGFIYQTKVSWCSPIKCVLTGIVVLQYQHL